MPNAAPFTPAQSPVIIDNEMTTTRRFTLVASITALGSYQLTSDFGSLPTTFSSVLAVEGERTTDDREIVPNALRWRELPIPLNINHDRDVSQIVGRIDTITRQQAPDGVYELHAKGIFDLGSDVGREAARKVSEGFLRGISMELEIEEHEILQEGDCDDEEIGGGENCHRVMRVIKGRIMGAGLVGQPAFARAAVVTGDEVLPEGNPDGRPLAASALLLIDDCEDCDEPIEPVLIGLNDQVLIASSVPLNPPSIWFAEPDHDSLIPLTVTPEGRVFGYIAGLTECHTGYEGQCLRVPRSSHNYEFFLTGELTTDDDVLIPVGQLTIGNGHASLNASPAAAKAHYDGGPGAIQWADVTCGEDRHGIWVAGAVRPGVSAETLRAARATAPSGDWRRIRGSLELIAVTQVPVPGYPIPRAVAASLYVDDILNTPQLPSVRMADNQAFALIAAGRVTPSSVANATYATLLTRIDALSARCDLLERIIESMDIAPAYREQMVQAIRG